MLTIHRAGLTARPVCGADSGRFSTSGAGVTCPACAAPAVAQTPRAARREPHDHYCTSGEHTVYHVDAPCTMPLRIDACTMCAETGRAR